MGYAGGATQDWLDNLDGIELRVTYQDGKNPRSFVLGGFIDERDGYTLKLNPPVLGLDWIGRSGQEITLTFSSTPAADRAAEAAVAPGPALADPVAEANTLVEFIARTTPGGGVVAQGLIVIVVWYLYLVTPLPVSDWRPLGGVLVLLMASWGPVVLGFGSPLAGHRLADEHGARFVRL